MSDSDAAAPLSQRLREKCRELRDYPELADIVPLLREAADRLDTFAAQVRDQQETIQQLTAERDSNVIAERKAQQKLEHRTLSMQDVVRARDDWHRKWELAAQQLARAQEALQQKDDEVEHWHSHYEAALLNWNESIRRMKEAEAKAESLAQQLARAREALQQIAEHDGDRHDWSEDVAIPKRTPQEIAKAALAPLAGRRGDQEPK